MVTLNEARLKDSFCVLQVVEFLSSAGKRLLCSDYILFGKRGLDCNIHRGRFCYALNPIEKCDFDVFHFDCTADLLRSARFACGFSQPLGKSLDLATLDFGLLLSKLIKIVCG